MEKRADGNEVDIGLFKEVLEDMEKKMMIEMKGKEGKESYFVNSSYVRKSANDDSTMLIDVLCKKPRYETPVVCHVKK